jgi:hypothetical protein
VQPVVTNLHVLEQLNVPAGSAPIVTVAHVSPSSAVPSHSSVESSRPLPHKQFAGAAPQTPQPSHVPPAQVAPGAYSRVLQVVASSASQVLYAQPLSSSPTVQRCPSGINVQAPSSH